MTTLCHPQGNQKSKRLLPSTSTLAGLAMALMGLASLTTCVSATGKPLKVLLIASGGYHDYKMLAPFLSTNLSQRVNATVDVKFGLDLLANPKFADGYDAVVYDVCDDETTDANIENVLSVIRAGKPAVMVHCSIHAFRKSPRIVEWETLCGMRSKVHDAFGPFTVNKLDPASAITKSFPDDWTTPGDELYQTISIDPQSHQLLKAKSPRDGRTHVVCWTCQFGKGRVFCTTLGHDMKTTATPEYLGLLANGLLWSCSKLESDGKPSPGHSPAARQ